MVKSTPRKDRPQAKKILAATDFSGPARSAVFYAAEIAAKAKRTLVLMNVFQPQNMGTELSMLIPAFEASEKDSMRRLFLLGRTLQQKYGKALKVELESRCGSAPAEIRKYAESHDIGMIVMGMQGKSPLENKLMGSTSTSMIHHTGIPVIIVHKGNKISKTGKIVLAVDPGATLPENLVNTLHLAMGTKKPQVEVLYVSDSEDPRALDEKLMLERVRSSLKGLRHRTNILHGEDVVKKIDRFSKKEAADLVVMFPKQHGFWDRLFNGSKSSKLAFNGGVPLLTINAN